MIDCFVNAVSAVKAIYVYCFLFKLIYDTVKYPNKRKLRWYIFRHVKTFVYPAIMACTRQTQECKYTFAVFVYMHYANTALFMTSQ